ncbi:MAG TPA: efflux RND transporter periplasmic adaptor subunit [Syntrophorhabdaceae bacterium]|nr:Multidrug export protein AcrE [Syntrophorhabdaceae bacterium]HOG40225.1 efflux RND transporter periplasmic adaptor subunit [Syntrophorhabdaceae bacterium]HOS05704.1 efflux RND transporter periplasmic adaptor subunit [Syntrophorhabdaceae bacterium]HPL40991.1 efflux RND transporter periplasmic adaptor subunit [Syntrophorhabdaceae bacterium]
MNKSIYNRPLDKRTAFSSMKLFICAISVGLIFAMPACGKKNKEVQHTPDVEVANVVQKDVPIYGEWVGTTDGLINATIRAQVQGYLIKRNYNEGDFVKKGQVLFEIDPRTFRATVDEAKGQLAQWEARWQTAKANLNRIKPLAEQNAVSKKDLDDAIGSEQSTYASVLSARAALERAELNLGFTKVTSLIDGIAGIAKAQIGDLVGPGQLEELTTVSTVNPIKVYISASEQEYLKAAETHFDAEKLSLEMVLTDGKIFPHRGKLILADRQIDVKTGTIKLGAVFKNPNNVLRPGQFAKVRAVIYSKKDALLVPQRAVTELQGSYQIAVVGSDNKVDIRPVKMGERVENMWVVDSGLKAGERVIAEGIQKVAQGMLVNPKPFGANKKATPDKPSEANTKDKTSPKTEKR